MAVKDFKEYIDRKKVKPAPVEVEISYQVFKGPKGDKGDTGPQGPIGPPGSDGKSGADGRNGVDGRDGADGKDGARGPAGPSGKDGKSADTALLEALRARIDALAAHEAAPEKKKEFVFTIIRDYNGFIKEVTAKEI